MVLYQNDILSYTGILTNANEKMEYTEEQKTQLEEVKKILIEEHAKIQELAAKLAVILETHEKRKG